MSYLNCCNFRKKIIHRFGHVQVQLFIVNKVVTVNKVCLFFIKLTENKMRCSVMQNNYHVCMLHARSMQISCFKLFLNFDSFY